MKPSQARPTTPRGGWRIENGTVITGGLKPEVLERHTVLVEGDRIKEVMPSGSKSGAGFRRIDASGKLVMPGLVNAHTHLYSTFARGLTNVSPSTGFIEVLEHLWWRLDSALTAEDCYYSALVPLIESIRHGTTTVFDHHASPRAVNGSLEQIARAVSETGLRACLCYEVSDRDRGRIAKAGLFENTDFIRSCMRRRRQETSLNGAGCHLAGLFGLHAAFTLEDRTLARAAEMGAELGTGFHIHVAEDAADQQIAKKRHGKRVVERLHEHRILGPGTIAAHCVQVDGREMELLAETQTTVVHNPQSNLNNAVGIADLPAMRRRGVRVGLGTDAMTTNMLEEARVALWAQHLGARNPSCGFAEVTTALFGTNAALASQTFGTCLGEIRPGAAADIILVDYDPPTPLLPQNVFGHIIFGVSQSSVDTTLVAGKALMLNKRLTLDLDEAEICARARERARKLWQRM